MVCHGGQVWRHVDEEGVLHFSSAKEYPQSEQILLEAQSRASRSGTQVSGRAFTPELASLTLDAVDRSERYLLAHPDLSSAAATYGVDYELLKAVAIAESGFNAKAVSPKGAVGLMQVMPATAQRYGVQPAAGKTVSAQLTDPALNIATGARYLADLLKMFSGRLDLVLAAYNAGENAVKRAGHQIPDYRETRDYVVKVMALYDTQKARAR